MPWSLLKKNCQRSAIALTYAHRQDGEVGEQKSRFDRHAVPNGGHVAENRRYDHRKVRDRVPEFGDEPGHLIIALTPLRTKQRG